MIKKVLSVVIVLLLLLFSTGCDLLPLAGETTASEVENGIFNLVNEERVAAGLSTLSRSTELDALAAEYAASEWATETGYSTNLIYLMSNTWLLDFGTNTPRLTVDHPREQVDFCMSQESMREALLVPEATETGVGSAIVGNKVYFVQAFDVIRSTGATGNRIELNNNPDAVDPTWTELLAFLMDDDTDDIPYVEDSFICGDFAETLHNNAEAAGWRAAYVSVRLPEEPGHAMNAFMVNGTTLVFVDAISSDKGVYMEIDKHFGVILLEVAYYFTPNFTYAEFETYVAQFNIYHPNNRAAYNAEKVAYDNEEPVPSPYTSRQEWAEALDAWAAALGIGGPYFLPTESLYTEDPTVVHYYVHW